jgi:hypothetical protein
MNPNSGGGGGGGYGGGGAGSGFGGGAGGSLGQPGSSFSTARNGGADLVQDGGNGSVTISSGCRFGELTEIPRFTLQLEIGNAGTCTVTNIDAIGGTWVSLPTAHRCTATTSGATLLGWATLPQFPVVLAQRQVSNGWGAFELFASDGQRIAIFIPAGGATHMSGSNTLFAIWNS